MKKYSLIRRRLSNIWQVFETDGHDARARGAPHIVIANTVKEYEATCAELKGGMTL